MAGVFYLDQTQNAENTSSIPSDVFIPLNTNRNARRKTAPTQGGFATTPPNNSISLNTYLTNWLANNFDAGDIVYPLTGAFDVNATTATIDSTAATTITGGTGLTLDVTTGDMGLNTVDGNVIISPAAAFTATATAGDVTLTATAGDVILDATTGDVLINAGYDIILTPAANLVFTLAAIPTYADDAAAGTGGLTAGQVYKTAAGALMIKL